jgi:hypothetical protein
MTVERFLTPIPEAFLKDSGTAEWARQVTLYLDDLSRPEGTLATSEATTEVVLTQQEKLDLMVISQEVNLDTVEAQAAAATLSLADLLNSLPDYNISNDGTVRTLNADAGLITAGATYSQTDFQQLIDAVGVLSDVVATVIRDLENKGIFSV